MSEDRLFQDDRKDTVTQITTGYNQDMEKNISESADGQQQSAGCQLRTGIHSMVGLEIGINNMKGCLRPAL